MKRRVVVAMSGGVDSSVAAALLKNMGHEVIGFTMCLSVAAGGPASSERRRPACCGPQAIEDARRVCHKLGIRHYVVNMQKDLKDRVIDNFCLEYLKGRTPNPCVRCNQYLKFGSLLKKARSINADYLATGHYARIEKESGPGENSRLLLKKAKDPAKDQSYFLYRLNQRQMSRVLFPLGEYTKEEVRRLAKEFDLPVAGKKESQEICFVADDDYRGFLREVLGRGVRTGAVVDNSGKVLGSHKGIAFYTLGQRKGLGIACGWPAYVTGIDVKGNRLILGRKEEAYKREFTIKDKHFLLGTIKKKIALKVKIRYNHKEANAWVWPREGKINVRFRKRQFAITPGQSAVFYDSDKVIGGGIIDEVKG